MSPQLALFGSLVLIAWLFWRDAHERPVGSRTLWISYIWLLILSTRPVAYWVETTPDIFQGDVGGSPADLVVLGMLIVAILLVLMQRRTNWATFISGNRSIFILYLFFLCSILWADYPFAAFKRIVKDFSAVLFALAILTERDPAYAIRKLYLRCSYVVFTLSIVTIKYFPAIGTNRSNAGDNMFTGLTTQKNTLGEVVFTYSIILIWDLVALFKEGQVTWHDSRVIRRFLMLFMAGWLMLACDSQTSLICLIAGIALFWGTGRLLRMRRPKQKLVALAAGLSLVFGLDSTFQITEAVVNALGRDMTFTGRTNIWTEVLAEPVDPLFGTGFMMFWDGAYGRDALGEMGVNITTAHNGYLDVYLDGGIIGIALLTCMLLMRGNIIIDRLIVGHFWGRLGFIFWVLALIYNISESSFFRLGPSWFLLVFSMITPPSLRNQPRPWRNDTLPYSAR